MNASSSIQLKNMKDGQLRTNSVTDPRILNALATTHREAFVPAHMAGNAFVDEDIPLGNGRFMLEPLVFASLLGKANPQPDDKALLIGTGFGYAAAVLSQLVNHVTAIECDGVLLEESRKRLKAEAHTNIELHKGPLQDGWPHHSYDVILIDGGVQFIPESLSNQLAPNGRLVTVEVLRQRPTTSSGVGQYLIIQRDGSTFPARREGNAFVPVLPGFVRSEGFTL
jgi:protein-L-isoaspartate(D-aspartate) O-methyltransferase